MEQNDTYKTLAAPCEGIYKEKMSRFLAFAHPVRTVEEAMAVIDEYRNRFHDARHVCWAYVLGPDGSNYRMNDNGEPSGTAGKPIRGQILSFGLTNVVMVVVRYFGGIKLGTGGLIVAYRTAASEALGAGVIEERLIEQSLTIAFEYPSMNDVMRIVKEEGATVLSQQFELSCRMELSIRLSQFDRLKERFEKIQFLTFPEA